jgi:Protein of unknown function (DUF3237)
MNTQPIVPATSAQSAVTGELIYEYTARFTHVTDYSLALADVLSGAAAPPREGLRCDVGFAGPVSGPKLRGTVTGVDYGNLRADGRSELHIHAQITTEDGKHIALAADGVAIVEPGAPTIPLRENVTLTTSEPDYAWVNALQIWATGTVDFTTGEIHVSAHAA